MHVRGYHAVTLGELELAEWEFTRGMLAEYPLPVVCTNVEQVVDGQWSPIGERTRIVEINGIQVGFASVIGEGQLSQALIDKTAGAIRLLPPMETATAAARELRAKADVVVLLAHLDPRAMEQYATILTDVDVILGGHVTQKDEAPAKIGNAIVNRSGTRGQYVAITRLILSPDDQIVDYGGVNFTLGPGYAENEAVKAEVELAKEESARLRKEKAAAAIQERRENATLPPPDDTPAPQAQ